MINLVTLTHITLFNIILKRLLHVLPIENFSDYVEGFVKPLMTAIMDLLDNCWN